MVDIKKTSIFIFALLLIVINIELVFKLLQYFLGELVVLHRDTLFLLVFLFSIYFLFKKKIPIHNILIVYIFISFFFLILINYLFNVNNIFNIYWNMRTTILFPLILSIYFTVLSSDDFVNIYKIIVKITKVFLLLNIFLASIQFYLQAEYYTLLNIPIDKTLIKDNSVLGMIRAPGLFRSNDMLGIFALISVMILTFYKNEKNRFYIILSILLVLLSTLRTAFIGLFIFFLIYNTRKYVFYYFIIVMLLPIVFVLYYQNIIGFIINILSEIFDESTVSLFGGSLLARFDVWGDSIAIIKNLKGINFLFGVNYNSLTTIDNLYLFIYMHYGLVGFLFILFFFIGLIFYSENTKNILLIVIPFLYMGIFSDLIQNILFQVYFTFFVFYFLNVKERYAINNRL